MSSTRVESLKTVVRPANAGDIANLEILVNLAYRGGKASVGWKNEHHLVRGPRTTAAEIDALLGAANAQLLVAVLPEQGLADAVGCVLVEKHDAEIAHIGMIAVNPDFQNYGLGRTLVSAAETYAQNVFNCTTAKMFVISGRDELLSWYERLGFVKTGETLPFFGPESGVVPIVDGIHLIVIAKDIH